MFRPFALMVDYGVGDLYNSTLTQPTQRDAALVQTGLTETVNGAYHGHRVSLGPHPSLITQRKQ
jgi:hypothetical protein